MTNKSLMTHYLEGALVSRELHDMMHQYAADARFEVELSGHEDNLNERMYGGKRFGRRNVLIHEGNADDNPRGTLSPHEPKKEKD